MRNIIRRWITTKDTLRQLIIYMVFALFLAGLVFLFYAYVVEASRYASSFSIFPQLGVQIVAFVLGIGIMYAVSRIRYQVYAKHIFTICILSGAAMLTLLTPLAIERNGATRWIDLGILQFQPSEIMKLAFILFFAYLFTQADIRNNVTKLIGITIGAFMVLAAASWLQPDYGTALIIGVTVLGMAIVARLPMRWWVVILVSGLIGVGTIVFSQSYISTRITTFYDIHFGELTPEQRYGVAYQPLQNLKAVRIGGITGQGLGFTAQSSQLSIPELTTDSIFALVAAETGFIGSVVVILAFLFFFILCYTVADITRDTFGKYVVVGISTLFAAQFFINILVVLALPATGIPLIFFSKGGTSLLMTLTAIGIIINVLRQQSAKRDIYRGSLL